MSKKLKIVVLSGAGISAESGIATFRGAGGLWEGHSISEVATPDGWQRNPGLVLEFYNQRRKNVLEAVPNEAHLVLAQMESDFDVQVITQNIDDLHERAGSSNILHLHGEIRKARSTHNPDHIEWIDDHLLNVGDVCPYGSQLRPHIVWFGEDVPLIQDAADLCAQADVLVIVGTSLNVYPAAGLRHSVPLDTPTYLIDPNADELDLPKEVFAIAKVATEGMKELYSILSEKR
ncbi:MAG: SIR2 family NAD-dependent protein deacylase [Flavobacteriales bacterium]